MRLYVIQECKLKCTQRIRLHREVMKYALFQSHRDWTKNLKAPTVLNTHRLHCGHVGVDVCLKRCCLFNNHCSSSFKSCESGPGLITLCLSCRMLHSNCLQPIQTGPQRVKTCWGGPNKEIYTFDFVLRYLEATLPSTSAGLRPQPCRTQTSCWT